MGDIRFPAVVRYRFETDTESSVKLPGYPGSVWRGLLGAGLRRTACVTRQPDCAGCLLQRSCSYFAFFETAVDQDPTGRSHHPFVLDLRPDVPETIAPGESLIFGLTLIGNGIAHLPQVIYAIEQAGPHGIGRGRGRFRLRRVLQEATLSWEDWTPIYPIDGGRLRPLDPGPVPLPAPPEAARIDLVTPLRIKRRGRFIGPHEFQPADFLRHLCWRLDHLAADHGVAPGFWADHRERIAVLPVGDVAVGWVDWTRYSARQATTMKLGGLIGTLALPREVVPGLWPLVWLGQWVHVGKATTFGLGAYRLSIA